MSLDSGSSTESSLKLLQLSDMKADPYPLPGNDQRNVKISENFRCLILNLGMHIVLTNAVFGKFAYPRITRYADNIRFSHKENLKYHYVRVDYMEQ